MLGLRGVRLGIHIPELTIMQVRAIFEAACMVAKEGIDVHPEVMIPLTSHVNELKVQRKILEAEAKIVMKEQGIEPSYKFGTMIEIPRAALTCDQIAEYAAFISFGTNDLTQTTFGISRDDAEAGFLIEYMGKRNSAGKSVRRHRSGRSRLAHGNSGSKRTVRAARSGMWYLRRTRR